VSVWDGMNKKRVKQIGKYDTSISALAFNCTGTCLAIAASYTFEEGEKEHPTDSIIIRQVSESDVKPKAK
jgi:cell cycle arrest protein BUB3